MAPGEHDDCKSRWRGSCRELAIDNGLAIDDEFTSSHQSATEHGDIGAAGRDDVETNCTWRCDADSGSGRPRCGADTPVTAGQNVD